MKKEELRIEKIGGNGITSRFIFHVPVQINDTWTYNPDTKDYTKSATNQTDALAIRDIEVLGACK
jgi:hypothetical protein